MTVVDAPSVAERETKKICTMALLKVAFIVMLWVTVAGSGAPTAEQLERAAKS